MAAAAAAAAVVVLTPAPSVSLCVGGLRSELSFATDSDSGRMIVSRAHCNRAKTNQTVAQAVPRDVSVGEESQLLLCQSFVVDGDCGCMTVDTDRADCGVAAAIMEAWSEGSHVRWGDPSLWTATVGAWEPRQSIRLQ